MTAIPVDPSLIANAINASFNLSAIPMKVCTMPPEGAKCIPLQFLFGNNTVWLCDLAIGQPPVSQIAAMYVDAINSSYDIIVVFPDTGYQVKVQAGNSLLCPVFTGSSGLPKFYVVLNSTGTLSASSVCNIILLNIYIPSFAA